MAKNNETKITMADAKRILEGNLAPRKMIWEGLEILVKPVIGLADMQKFVQESINSCFSKGGEFMPGAEDFAIRVNLIEKYTSAVLPSDIKVQYSLLYGTNLFEMVLEAIDSDQFSIIRKAIEKGIHFRASANIEAMAQKLNEIYAMVISIAEDFESKFGEIFGSVSAEDMKLIMKGISDRGGLDERKIVDAYLASKAENAPGEAPPDLVK